MRSFTPGPSHTREHGYSASPARSSANTHAAKTTSTKIILALGLDLFAPMVRGDFSSQGRGEVGFGIPLLAEEGWMRGRSPSQTGWSVRPKCLVGLTTPSAPSR